MPNHLPLFRLTVFAVTLFCSLDPAMVFAQPAAVAEPETQQQTQESVKPGINDNFLDPDLDVDSWVERFEVESREVFAARNEVLAAIDLKEGDRVADIGAGTGLYVTLFANEVSATGWVYAVELAVPFAEHLRDVAQKHDQTNVTPTLCDPDHIRLPPGSIDVAFTSDVYHHFEYPQKTLASIYSALKPGGRFVVVDFEKIPGVTREWLMDHVRADKQTVKAEIEQAGFEFVAEKKIEGFQENYLLVFRRPQR
ncbi:MAG: SAM-dependent methyltransferase [Planctomyces sp.]|nr:SAM-dependent methyltransferase [Planctomyces sp.]